MVCGGVRCVVACGWVMADFGQTDFGQQWAVTDFGQTDFGQNSCFNVLAVLASSFCFLPRFSMFSPNTRPLRQTLKTYTLNLKP